MADNRRSGGSDDCIRVALRVRPMVPSELDKGYRNVVTKTKGTAQVVVNLKDMFTFNHAFAQDETQEMIYTNAVKPMVLKLIKGYNVTILAYGQTGSGKTHTMGTNFNDDQLPDEIGIIPRAINEIFDRCDALSDTHTFEVSCSFIELYQEILYDLLSANVREQSAVDLHQNTAKQIIIANLTETVVNGAEEAFECLIKGSSRRAVGATAMNATSSRSHAIFTINVRLTCIETPENATSSKFHLVDLAGSERSNKTKATGTRFKEGVKINQGLLALGNVISSLGSGQTGHISYRDSKLTRLLQDSLGGNSVTLMIACVSPADYNMEESLSTLRYADRAKQIKNKAVINMDPHAAEIQRLVAENNSLRMELIEYRNSGVSLSKLDGVAKATKRRQSIVPTDEYNDIKNNYIEATKKNVQLSKELNSAVMELTSMSLKYYAAEKTNEELMSTLHELKDKVIDLNGTFGPDCCPAEYVVQGRAIAELKRLVLKANDFIQENQVEFGNPSMVDQTFVVDDEREIEYRSQQIDFHKALNDIQQQIRLKTEVSEKVMGNSVLVGQFDIEYQEKIIDYEAKIQHMEAELLELKNNTIDDVKKSKSDKNSAKLAEERRKKVKELETEIKLMQKKSQHQEMMLKQQEQYKKKVVVVQAELVQMKKRKVELVNKIKEAKDKFLKEKAVTTKEMIQLKANKQKAETALAKKVMESTRERNVAKTKLEAFMAVNKRLKETLEKQSRAQNDRRMKVSNSKPFNNADLKNAISNDIDIIYSLVDATESIKFMIEDRAQLNLRMSEIKNSRYISPEDAATIASLAEDIAMRNAQIDEMHKKLEVSSVNKNIERIAQSFTSMSEYKEAITMLLHTLAQLREAYDQIKYQKTEACEEIKNTEEFWKVEVEKLEKQTRILHDECQATRDLKNIMERAYEEKVAMLLYELSQSELNLDGVQKESERIRTDLLEDMRAKLAKCEEKNKMLEDRMLSTFLGSDDEERDPDWVQTPVVQDRRRHKRSSHNDLEQSDGHKSLSHKCNCKGQCHTKVCGCRKLSRRCEDECGCDPTRCKNKSADGLDGSSILSENMSSRHSAYVSDNVSDKSLEVPQSLEKENLSPKRNRLDMDQTTTPYPYTNKKKRPLLD